MSNKDKSKEKEITVENKNIKKEKKEKELKLWIKRNFLFKEDFIDKLINKKIINNESLHTILKDHWTKFETILEFMNCIVKHFPEKENTIIKEIFNWSYWFETNTVIDNKLTVSLTIQDLFAPSSASKITQDKINNIFSNNILPLYISEKGKKYGLVLISRTPEVPNNFLNIIKPVVDSKNISFIEKIIIVDKKTYDYIYKSLTVFDYADEL